MGGRAPQYPLFFAHGLFGWDTLRVPHLRPIHYWRGVLDVLQAQGVQAQATQVPLTGSMPVRASQLERQIDQYFDRRGTPPSQRVVNLVGHSMGGLDARFLVARQRPSWEPDPASDPRVHGHREHHVGHSAWALAKQSIESPPPRFQVASATTITSPHRGSKVADTLLDHVLGRQHIDTLCRALEQLHIPGGGQAFEELTVRFLEVFNRILDDAPDASSHIVPGTNTKMFSWGASFVPPRWHYLYPFYRILLPDPNDGLVTVPSSKWGQYQGTLEGVHHMRIIGWAATLRKSHGPPPFHAAQFYEHISRNLAREGF